MTEEQKIVYMVYSYCEGKDGFWNPILYADFALAEADSESRVKELQTMNDSNVGVRIHYLAPPLGEYKSFTDYAIEEYEKRN
jgi:hypothetical protein